jgi:hypothetical protein
MGVASSVGSGVGTGVTSAGASVGRGSGVAVSAALTGVWRSADGLFSSSRAVAASSTAPAAHTQIVLICLRLRAFSALDGRLALGVGLSDMIASCKVAWASSAHYNANPVKRKAAMRRKIIFSSRFCKESLKALEIYPGERYN